MGTPPIGHLSDRRLGPALRNARSVIVWMYSPLALVYASRSSANFSASSRFRHAYFCASSRCLMSSHENAATTVCGRMVPYEHGAYVDHEGQSFNEHHVTGRSPLRYSPNPRQVLERPHAGHARRRNQACMSMTGLAGRPGIAVLPKCSTRNTKSLQACFAQPYCCFLEDSWPSRVIADDDHMLRFSL